MLSGTHHLNTVVLVKMSHTLFGLLQPELMVFSAVILVGEFQSHTWAVSKTWAGVVESIALWLIYKVVDSVRANETSSSMVFWQGLPTGATCSRQSALRGAVSQPAASLHLVMLVGERAHVPQHRRGPRTAYWSQSSPYKTWSGAGAQASSGHLTLRLSQGSTSSNVIA